MIGGGFGGLLVGARLREAGVDDVRIIEKGGDFGGTWYWNRYPGAACDIESYIYLPLLEEVGYVPKEKYSRAPEILEHSRRIARHFDLYERACLQTEVTELRWDESARALDRRDRTAATRCAPASWCMANGPLHRPKLPGIPGVESFEGHSFHTSRWDYAYTGGDSRRRTRRACTTSVVGIIGTGATAVQCVPHLGAAAKHLYVFQRTPSSIDVRANRPTDPDWAASLEPGWQQRRMDNFNNLVSGDSRAGGPGQRRLDRHHRQPPAPAARRATPAQRDEHRRAALELADFEKMEQIRARVDASSTTRRPPRR